MLSKQDFIEKTKTRSHIMVSIPDIGDARLRAPSRKEIEVWEEYIANKNKGDKGHFSIRGMKVILISICLVDENDKLIFNWRDPVDFAIMNDLPSTVTNVLWKECSRLSGIDSDEVVKEMEKNSGKTEKSSGGSDLPDKSEDVP